jgi:hypothetical protein
MFVSHGNETNENKTGLNFGNACYCWMQKLCLLVCCQKTQNLEYTRLSFCLCFCIGATASVV